MVAFTTEQTTELAWGLKESNLHFMWVVTGSEIGELPDGFFLVEQAPRAAVQAKDSRSIGYLMTVAKHVSTWP
ncbi:unnamed protein product [Dovyalis caffra]|uniref:Uncharacterized protein n=1 Tax=Dovyalis caffra TaxID=77055 RepID=A0AAV1RBP3_9ROSI|nr:unnamed protein product [Dovyalis caffra]